MSEVFVSYSHRDQEKVSRIAGALEKSGFETWWDRRLRAHQDYGLEIEAALRRANCAVVAWSAGARDSLWVRAEATEAWETDKLVQITLDGAKPPLPFTMIHLLNLSGWGGETSNPLWSELQGAVEAVMNGRKQALEESRTRPLQLAGFGGSAAVGAASLGLIIVASGIVGVVAAGGYSTDLFGLLSSGMFLAALLTFGHMLTRVIKISRASR